MAITEQPTAAEQPSRVEQAESDVLCAPAVERYQPYPDSVLSVYYATCPCGWRGPERTLDTQADNDARGHAAESPMHGLMVLLRDHAATPGDALRTLLLRPWEAAAILAALTRQQSAPSQPQRWQACPVCNGAGSVTRPPWVPGDVQTWYGGASAGHVCPTCKGARMLDVLSGNPPPQLTLVEPQQKRGPDGSAPSQSVPGLREAASVQPARLAAELDALADFLADEGRESASALVRQGAEALAANRRGYPDKHLRDVALDEIARAAHAQTSGGPLKIAAQVKWLADEYQQVTARLQECVQRHHLGLGGERVDELVCDEVDRLRGNGHVE
jgi:hypothetical protein